MVIVEAIGAAVERFCARWPRVALFVLFTSPLWLNVGLQLLKHWSAE